MKDLQHTSGKVQNLTSNIYENIMIITEKKLSIELVGKAWIYKVLFRKVKCG